MFCTKCGSYRPDDHKFCIHCGTMRPVSAPAKKGKLWPPIVILIFMFAIGAGVYFFYMADQPTVSDTPWFSVTDGTLYFDSSRYTGGSELEIPSTVDGQTVTALGPGCFEYCDELTTVTLPDTLQTIGDNCFWDCEGLRGVDLPDSLVEIGSGAFYSCGALEALSVPASVETIGADAFGDCGRLLHIFYEGTQEQWQALYSQEITPNTQIYTVDRSAAGAFAEP